MTDRNLIALRRIELIDEIVRCAAPVLAWDKEKADVWLPGLHDALAALKTEENDCRDATT